MKIEKICSAAVQSLLLAEVSPSSIFIFILNSKSRISCTAFKKKFRTNKINCKNHKTFVLIRYYYNFTILICLICFEYDNFILNIFLENVTLTNIFCEDLI